MSANATANSQQSFQVNPRGPILLIALCFTLSGAAGLVYEVLWARMLGLVFGATTVAISVVLAAFMGGLALGSALGGQFASRIKRPLRAYGLIEIAIGLYALAIPICFHVVDRVDASLWQSLKPGTFGFALVRFLLAAMVLVIPTALMGATLPILVAAFRSFGEERAVMVSRLYGLNLAGAIGGALAAGFFLLPAWGVRSTTWVAAGTNLLIGFVVVAFDRDKRRMPRPSVQVSGAERLNLAGEHRYEAPQRLFWLLIAFASGFITIGMQVVWSRLLAMIIGSSTYAFTIVLALFLGGLALGAWLVSLSGRSDQRTLRRFALVVQLLIALSLFLSFRATSSMPGFLVSTAFKLGVNSWLGLLALQLTAATILILAPAILMGMVMPLVLAWAGTADPKRSAVPKSVGLVYALNTLGAIAGAIVTTFVLIPMASTRFAVFCMAAISIFVAAIAYRPREDRADLAVARSVAIGAGAVIIIAMLFLWPRLSLNELSAGAYDSFIRVLAKSRNAPDEYPSSNPEDHQLLMYEEGRTATVSVRRDWGITSMAINGRTNASDADDMPTQIMLGQLGILTAPRLNNALIVGFATGVTAGSILQSPVKSVECVEIEPAAIASSRYFEHVNNHPLSDSRLRTVVDDARTYLRINPTKYDLIISEPSHPWVPGVANLFTREFFTLGRERLGDGGVFVQWLQIYQLSTESLRSVLATFHSVFPHVTVFRIEGAAKGKDLILLGSAAPLDLALMSQRMNEPLVRAELNRIGLKSADDVRAWFVCDESSLGPAVASAVINTDDNMHVETNAPREAFRATLDANSTWIESLRAKRNAE